MSNPLHNPNFHLAENKPVLGFNQSPGGYHRQQNMYEGPMNFSEGRRYPSQQTFDPNAVSMRANQQIYGQYSPQYYPSQQQQYQQSSSPQMHHTPNITPYHQQYNYMYPQQQIQSPIIQQNHTNWQGNQINAQNSPNRNTEGLLVNFCPPPIIPSGIHDPRRGLNGIISQVEGENFEQIFSSFHGSRDNVKVYVDPNFPTSHPTHYRLPPNCTSATGDKNLQWRRITDVFPHAGFYGGVAQSQDVIQGLLGNCWFIGALATFVASPTSLEKVMPQPWPPTMKQVQPFHYECSMFRFRFWKWGKWIEVIVDDRLPFVADAYGNLLQPPQIAFARCNNPAFFWVSLLEKAYAKLHGSYAALDAGTAADALIDLTGGVAEVIDMRPMVRSLQSPSGEKEVKDLWKTLKQAAEHEFFINCTNKTNSALGAPATIADHSQLSVGGLLLTHVYSPWGVQEWKGAWAVGSPEWKNISDEQRGELQASLTDKGQFLISLDDFMLNFTHVSICRTINSSVQSRYSATSESFYFGAWCKPFRAGGCKDNITWSQNPQYQVILNKAGVIIVSLQQKENRLFGYSHQRDFTSDLSIGFHVFKSEKNRTFRLHQKTSEVGGNKKFINTRQVAKCLELDAGNYIIVPVTYAPGYEGEYLMRVCSYESSICRELMDEIPRELSSFPAPPMIISLWINQLKLEKRSGFHFDKTIFVQCSMGSSRHVTRFSSELITSFDEGFLFYSNTKSSIMIDVIHPSKFKKEKTIGDCQFTLDQFLAKPRGSRVRARATLTKSGSSEIVGTLEYTLAIYADPLTV